MEKRMSEQELLDSFDEALREGHIFVCYQPKINHSTGRMIGAEALMRWKHPVYGMQYPSDFIPILEEIGFISVADLYVFEHVCKFQRYCLDHGIETVPISVNMSRYDIFRNKYVDEIEKIRLKYDIPVELIHVEITESSAIGGMELVSSVLERLHNIGYMVEMDDFGSGYSSLNVLKDLDVDVIKLDMRFLSGNVGGRGGAIISAIVQMTKWLDTPVIAEGVETRKQADYMQSLGCSYIQGYLYSEPVTEDKFLDIMTKLEHEPMQPVIHMTTEMDAAKFWDPNSIETLLFNNYVGGAAIVTYRGGRLEMTRVNKKYMTELGVDISEKELLAADPWEFADEEGRKIYEDTLKRAIESGEEESCETMRTVPGGTDVMWVRSSVQLIGRADDQYIFYVMVRNITAEKKNIQ